MTTITRDQACEDLARTAWLLSEHGPLSDITGLARKIATQTNGDWSSIRDGIIAGLCSLSHACDYYYQAPGDGEFACIGCCDLGPQDCYWWTNAGEACWSSDRPEWWDSQLEQWGVAC